MCFVTWQRRRNTVFSGKGEVSVVLVFFDRRSLSISTYQQMLVTVSLSDIDQIYVVSEQYFSQKTCKCTKH